MKTQRILIVDDEPDAVELAAFNLKAAGFKVLTATDGQEALRKAQSDMPDLILLDVMLPNVDGLEVTKILRRNPRTASIPILMLTAKGSEVDRVVGLELGADDYLTKPFSPREMVLRIKGLLRRRLAASEETEIIRLGILEINIPEHTAVVGSETIDLTSTEFKLLCLLAQRRGRVQSRDQLLRDVWNYEVDINTRTVDTHVRRLREKLGKAAHYLETVRGVGYRMVES